jgi:hypothetical protein
VTENRKKRLSFSIVFGSAISAVFWFLNSVRPSPAVDFFDSHPLIGKIMDYFSFPAVLGGIAASGNVHQPSELVTYALLAVQGAFIGYLLSLAVFRSNARA